MKFSLLICLLIHCSIAVQAQTRATTEDGRKVILNADGSWKYAEDLPSVTLKIEAGIVYNYGGPEPVARRTFALLDADPLPEIAKLPPSRLAAPPTRLDVNNAQEEFLVYCGPGTPEALAVIDSHTRHTMTTGFDGKGEFTGVKPGKYWLLGSTKMRATQYRTPCAFWLIPLDLTKNQNLILDQNNAVIGKPMTFR